MVLENDGDKCPTKTSQADTLVGYGAIARVWMIARYLGFLYSSFCSYRRKLKPPLFSSRVPANIQTKYYNPKTNIR